MELTAEMAMEWLTHLRTIQWEWGWNNARRHRAAVLIFFLRTQGVANRDLYVSYRTFQ